MECEAQPALGLGKAKCDMYEIPRSFLFSSVRYPNDLPFRFYLLSPFNFLYPDSSLHLPLFI